MATNNSVNSPLSGTTGTGSFVGSTSPTITTPRIAQINDTNGNANIATSGPVSPVNYWTSVSSATGGLTGLEVTGTDTNANGYIKAKGDAAIAIITSAVTANPLVIYSGTGQQHVTSFGFSNTAANRLVTFPDLTGTVALSGASQNVTFGTVQTSQINDTNGNASLKFYPTPSAVNYLQIDNDVAGGDGPAISCVGSSAAMNLRLAPKGGAVQIQTTNAGGTALRIDTGSPTLQHATFLQFPLTSAITTVTFPDATGTVALSGASQDVTFNSVSWSDTTKGIVGTTTNNSASAGYVGEIISSAAVVNANNAVITNVTSISLTAGDWDVWGNVTNNPAIGASLFQSAAWVSASSATIPAQTYYFNISISGAVGYFNELSAIAPEQRFSLSTTTTIYLSIFMQWPGGGNPGTSWGQIYARRRR